MEIKETYHFSPQDFDSKGKRTSDGASFRDVLKGFEYDFHERHSNYYALYLFANSRTMLLLSHSCNARKNMIYGMELIDGEFDPNTNHFIEEASDGKNIVVYGIDSAFMQLDENGVPKIDAQKGIYPLTLLVDNRLKDNVLHLKYLDDDNSNDEDWATVPTNIYENSYAR